jgi:hypothetical protein
MPNGASSLEDGSVALRGGDTQVPTAPGKPGGFGCDEQAQGLAVDRGPVMGGWRATLPGGRSMCLCMRDCLALSGWLLTPASRSPSVASRGHDTRAIQDYLGHKNIQHTVLDLLT